MNLSRKKFKHNMCEEKIVITQDAANVSVEVNVEDLCKKFVYYSENSSSDDIKTSNTAIEITALECEMAKIKYDSELRREDSIIQQSGHMQTAFSFSTAALFMIAPIVIEYRGILSLIFFLVAFSSVTFVLLFSLFAATIAQRRKSQELFPDILVQNKHIEQHENMFYTEEQRNKYLVESYAKVQQSLTANNKTRVKWVQYSMRAFYIALALSGFWFIVAICKMM